MVFGLYNAGAPHAVCRAFDDAVSRGTFRLTRANAVDAVRAYFTNDGDIARYLAYCNATLGRPYRAHYVRTLSAWQGAFASGEADPESGPARVPDAPLRPYRDFLVEYPASSSGRYRQPSPRSRSTPTGCSSAAPWGCC